MNVETVDTKSMKHNTFNGMHADTVDTGFELQCVSLFKLFELGNTSN